jgi:preprotein translocase subunit SecA
MAQPQVRRHTSGPSIAWKRWLQWGAWRRVAPQPGELEAALEIGELERAYARLSDEELRERGARYRRAVRVGTPTSELRADLLALLRELARRELGVRASDAQLAAACAAHGGGIAQLAPGEGKSLACVFTVALAALEGRGAHVLCADPYLARRGALRAAPLLEALDLRVAVLDPGPEGAERRKHYAADVLFTTADEIARDALVDGLAPLDAERVQPSLHAAIVDDLDALWLEPAGARWVARDAERQAGPPLAALARACVPELYRNRGGLSSVGESLAALLAPELGAEVVAIPPARASIRLDHPDALFTHSAARDRALVESTARAHVEGRPVLLAVASAAEEARLAEKLREAAVRCSVLEPRPGEVNAAVLERAGSPGAVTLAIRGVDRGIAIPLGRGVAVLGGLCVIATARPGLELADQLVRGWAGQRGAPGATRFFLSLDDAATFGPEAAGDLPRRWREQREPGPLGDPHARELRQLLAALERERTAALRRFAACSRVLEQQRRVAAMRRESLRADPGGREAHDAAWTEHLGRTDALRCELAVRDRGSEGFAAGAAASFQTFLAAAGSASELEPRGPLQLELEIDPAFRA